MANDTKPIIVCENLVKIYKVADLEVVALQGLDAAEIERTPFGRGEQANVTALAT